MQINNRVTKKAARCCLVLLLLVGVPGARAAERCVVLLHGLARTAGSMDDMAQKLSASGYHVVNIDYPSTDNSIGVLAESAVARGIEVCASVGIERVDFVTHSMGGILVRQYYSNHPADNVHRVVMLAPPNQGSQVVDELKALPAFEWIHGPAGLQLGTGDNSVPKQLGPVHFPLGVIAGTRSINPVLSSFLPNPDDGKVSLANTQVAGMCDFISVPVSHPFIMQDDTVIRETLHFLNHGRFSQSEETGGCEQRPE